MLPNLSLTPGETLRTIRERRGLTQDQAGQEIGISATHLSNIENGRALPGLDTAVSIAARFSIPVEAWSAHRQAGAVA